MRKRANETKWATASRSLTSALRRGILGTTGSVGVLICVRGVPIRLSERGRSALARPNGSVGGL